MSRFRLKLSACVLIAASLALAALAARRGLAGLRDAALIAVASDALLRVSELAELEVGDIDFGTGTVTVRKSKTDQEGEGAVLIFGQADFEADSEVVGGLWVRSWTTLPESPGRWGGRWECTLSPGHPGNHQG